MSEGEGIVKLHSMALIFKMYNAPIYFNSVILFIFKMSAKKAYFKNRPRRNTAPSDMAKCLHSLSLMDTPLQRIGIIQKKHSTFEIHY